MVLHGLRKQTNDLDVSVDYDVFQKILKGKHKFGAVELKPPAYVPGGFNRHAIIRISNDVEISCGGDSLICRPPVEKHGVRYQSLQDIYDFKSKLNRPKDRRDLEILEAEIGRQTLSSPKPPSVKKDVVFVKRKTVRGGDSRFEHF